jgi:predicted NBD/HSP70 family sugar kinase
MITSLGTGRRVLAEPTDYRVLRTVRESRGISRVEIAQRCHLSKPTVTAVVNRFLRAGVLRKTGEGPSTRRGGRKREILQFNPLAGTVAAIDLRMTSAHIALTDLNASILAHESFTYHRGEDPHAVLREAAHLLQRLLAHDRSAARHCAGVGVGLPGLIDRSAGTIIEADTLVGWKGINLRSVFADYFRFPVHIENDVKARTLAEYLFGVGKHWNDQVFLWIGDGIGAGIIINGSLHHGATESAGEIGYNALGFGLADPRAFPLLYSGQKDFGEILSNAVIGRSYVRHAGISGSGSVRQVLRKAEKGDPVALAILDEVAELVSVVCILLINMLNPGLVVIGGEIAGAGQRFLGAVLDRVRKGSLSVPAEAVQIAPGALGDDGVILGSAGLVLHELLQPGRGHVSTWIRAPRASD